MNVYIWTDSPYPLTKSIDVRGKTLAQIQAEGWTFHNNRGSYTLDSNGISISGGNTQTLISYYLPKNLNNNNKITLKTTGNCTSAEDSSKYGGVISLGLFNNTELAFRSSGVYGQYHSGYNSAGGFTGIGCNDVAISNTGPRNKGGNISFTTTIDLSNGECTYNITGPVSFSTTATLTSGKISEILSYRYLDFGIDEFTANYYMRLYTAEFTVE